MKKSAKGDLPDNDKDWISYIEKAHDAGLDARKKHEFQWVVNLSYYKGYQNLIFDPVNGVLSMGRDQQPLVVNRIGSFIEARHAKLTKNRPVPRVLPNDSDREDVRGAKYADQSLMHLWRKIEMEACYDKTVTQMLICGTSFMETLWNPNSGDKIKDYKTNEAQDLFVGDDGIEEEEVFMGEISTRPKSAFSFIPGNEMIPSVKDQPYIITRDRMTISELEMMIPEFAGKLKPEDEQSMTTEYERIVQRMGAPLFYGYGSKMGRQKQDSLGGEVLVKTFWMKPNRQYEKGLVAVLVNKNIKIMPFPNDYGDNIYPYVKFQEKEDGFSFWNQSTIERIIPIQRAINTIKQKKMRNIIFMANGKWMLSKGSQVNEEAITDEEGEVIEFNPAVPEPHQAQIAPLPNYVAETETQLLTDFRDAGGQRETTFAPGPNLSAAVAMQTQAELADEMINPIIRRLARSMEKVAQQQLMLMDAEYIEPRKIKIIGEEGSMAVQWISNLDLKHHTDVHIEVESLFPEFRGQKQQRLFDMWDRRIISDPNDFLKAIRFGDVDVLIDKLEKHDDKIWIDIQMMKKGKMPQPNPFVNPQEYVSKLMEFCNTPEFNKLIPERKQIFVQVIQYYMQKIAQMVANQPPVPEQNQAAVNTPSGPAVTQ